jgi:hypothetical protein
MMSEGEETAKNVAEKTANIVDGIIGKALGVAKKIGLPVPEETGTSKDGLRYVARPIDPKAAAWGGPVGPKDIENQGKRGKIG